MRKFREVRVLLSRARTRSSGAWRLGIGEQLRVVSLLLFRERRIRDGNWLCERASIF